MGCQEELLVEKVCEIYEKISRLETLKPSKDVNMLFTQLVLTCMPPSPNLDLTKLSKTVQEIRSKLIRLCGEAEGLLETHFSSLLGSLDNPLDNLNLFPYFSNYLKLSHLEFTILRRHLAASACPARAAFVGSGPLPLTSIVLAKNHLPTTAFHNYDIDPLANSLASRLVETDPDLSKHMFFHTTNILDVYNRYMAPGAILMIRSAHGARAFLYPVVDSCDLRGFEVLSVFHPTDEVINSVVIARKLKFPMHLSLDHEGLAPLMLPCKCSDQIQAFCPLNHEVAIEEHLS
ncbi:nicotianamine synthase 3 [Actinidia rufa]|uniref:Nicotianamine synthase n=1 Tax=Actinidia rufa TaxID=165716 RepID=A0A7J0DPT3_9ERIC|nr:nicotianamine synthase 3 [Actinidia rufa]